MNVKTDYSEKLKDPRWQKKRLKILERDQWKCQVCGADEKTLHVHHKEYVNGHEPWEYGDDFLLTLCEFCHDIEHGKVEPANVYLAGKISGNNDPYDERCAWRFNLINKGEIRIKDDIDSLEDWPNHEIKISKTNDIYTGPYFTKRCHGEMSDGYLPSIEDAKDKYNTKLLVAKRSRSQIMRSDIIFAHIDGLDCHGTLVEIGLAVGYGKKVYVAIKKELRNELWFPGFTGQHSWTYESATELPTIYFEARRNYYDNFQVS